MARIASRISAGQISAAVPGRPYFADFLSFRHSLVLEVDGGQHATQVAADQIRTSFIESRGFRVLRFWNNEVLSNVDGVLQVIAGNMQTTQ